MTYTVDGNWYHNKKALREALQSGADVHFQDQAVFNPQHTSSHKLKLGSKIVVTNHPKRSYFASIEKKVDGTFKVE